MKVRYWLALLALCVVMLGGSIWYLVWWQLAHNLQNIACSNVIYTAHHIAYCATWDRACGIVQGVALPLMFLGFLGAVGCGFGIAFSEDLYE
jgi:hypothetical protein